MAVEPNSSEIIPIWKKK